MTRRVVGLIGLGLVVLVLVQVSLVAPLPTPLAVPDLVVVTVLAIAYAWGPWVGGLAGAWAGILLDLVPPAAGPLGGWALVLSLVGAAMGRAVVVGRPGPFAAMVLVALGAASAVLGRTAVLWFSGTPVGVGALAVGVGAAAWAVLLAPVALLLATRVAGDPGLERTGPERIGPERIGPERTGPERIGRP